MNPTAALPGSMIWMGIRLSSGSRPQSPKGLPPPSATIGSMLHWLVVGIGDITTKRVLPAILAEPRSQLVGIVTRNPAKAETYNVPAWPDLAAALEQCEADAVYVATPVFLHAPQTIASLRTGRHVLCEKPMALNYAEASTMQQAATETGRT